MLPRMQQRQGQVTGWSELAGSELAATPEFGRVRGWRCGAREASQNMC